ncbi:hypothetical protein IFU37_023405 (plasmid) [Pantoea agglomerans]|uniref:hypothetical protein n=1 Tax=Enterobacter agglomerans TaxID=549 RepID=UPI001784440E|nr:hypothetical protein [Pantoea agglomerans]WVL92389.1 hypothetical protein IFU37_023405 [Pantoea agglomerans]
MNSPKILVSGLLLNCLFAGVSYAGTTSGEKVATTLNQRYEKVVSDCDGDPAYYCSGVIVRSNEDIAHATWQPYLRADEHFLQFSFLRKDMGFFEGAIWSFNDIGFGIVLENGKADGFKSRCIFPENAFSVIRKTNGCGDFKSKNKLRDEDEDNSTCESKGVLTSGDWIKKYGIGDGDYCSFSTHNAKYFNEAIKTSVQLVSDKRLLQNNELIINTSPSFWDVKDPSKDHIQALWYNPKTIESSSIHGLAGAQSEQKLYYQLTKKWIPILSINMSSEPAIFSYSESDQIISPQT